ncbi:hypothetical protein AVEN_108531-1 [Araneus ventricosus]|uniref:Uncharacterized protein n=1 Tax=Araneus ventricosus TaxID=182803 RepID=A0A4Y2R9D3_ARAVE|nr:hypothetical protein AVEN_108531-1 [Araneus ventricosus]
MTRTTSELAPLLQTSEPHQQVDVWLPEYDLICNKPAYTADLQWNRVSNLELSGPKAEILPLERMLCLTNKKRERMLSLELLAYLHNMVHFRFSLVE